MVKVRWKALHSNVLCWIRQRAVSGKCEVEREGPAKNNKERGFHGRGVVYGISDIAARYGIKHNGSRHVPEHHPLV
jgi:hypothetical protein